MDQWLRIADSPDDERLKGSPRGGGHRQEQTLVMTKLEQQAGDRGRSLRQLLDILSATVPDFVALTG
jgi:hypothetical protein